MFFTLRTFPSSANGIFPAKMFEKELAFAGKKEAGLHERSQKGSVANIGNDRETTILYMAKKCSGNFRVPLRYYFPSSAQGRSIAQEAGYNQGPVDVGLGAQCSIARWAGQDR
jgi:hypothetical protein